MLHDTQLCFMALGLKLAAYECKVVVNLSDEALDRSQKQFTGCGFPAEVLHYGTCHQYLGTQIGFGPFNGVQGEIAGTRGRRVAGMLWIRQELKHRMKLGWGAWHKYQAVLTDKRVRRRLRLRAFDSLVVSVILHGCRSWSLTADLKLHLDEMERAMLSKLCTFHHICRS